MAKHRTKKTPAETKRLSPFNIKQRYRKLNEDQKAIISAKYLELFDKVNKTFYNAMERSSLTDVELHFFADMFDCSIKDLYSQPRQKLPSVYALERQADGFGPGKQNSLDV